MRLKTIRLAGFKSFVDPTTIPIAGSLIGVVGPNGCGKSNIIDAVRWVMGESSASRLRGDSMADVIFNGSNARKPIGKASVELIFENNDGRAGGQYASYAEISIRRETGREGQSDYFLNKSRCRRKDITDLFLGTGLGPRAYSIIEQGMVTRIVEAKPEDLRGFIEEAAGISRYKERRRETENRIAHTKENLARVEDIRKELGTQLLRLNKQSKAAARYKDLKQEERKVRAQLLALRYRDLDQRLQTQDAAILQHQTALDAALAAQREVEARIELLRTGHTEALDRHNVVQGEYYAIGAEISRLEQAIEHARETRVALVREQEQLNRTWGEATEHLNADRQRLEELTVRADEMTPMLARCESDQEAGTAALDEAEEAMRAWQDEWETFGTEAVEPTKIREVQENRILQLERQIEQQAEREQRLTDEAQAIETELRSVDIEVVRQEANELDEVCARLEQSLNEINEHVRVTRMERETLSARLDSVRGEHQAIGARLAGLRELQTAAEAGQEESVIGWLARRDLKQAPRLARELNVEPGWETAVERALGARLAAVCATNIREWASELEALKPGRLAFIDLSMAHSNAPAGSAMLLDKVTSEVDLAPLLGGIYIAHNLEEAIERRDQLALHESIITRDGAWIGRNWISLENAGESNRGWLARSREIENLSERAAAMQVELDTLQTEMAQAMTDLEGREHSRDELARTLNDRQKVRAELRERLGHQQERLNRLETRARQIEHERNELRTQTERDRAEVDAAVALKQEAETRSGTHQERRARLQQRRQTLQEQLTQARERENKAREQQHELEIEIKTLHTSIDSTRASMTRIEGQLQHLSARRDDLIQLLVEDHQPENEFKQQLNGLLTQRLEIETRLASARQTVADQDTALREQEHLRQQEEKRVQEVRAELETERVARQEIVVRRDTHADQLREITTNLDEVLQELPDEAIEQEWSERLDQLAARIERLGPINLVAIEEFEELSQRKGFLDKQSEDLSQALGTLEEAIRKMDRETRVRFKETYDRVNEGFQNFFPRLFGGGSAHLELTDNDLLETGVTVMARPPGKRNSTIHLLSGGEKALTAVALLFAIFELNPAPFCLLDEVDAPLDDANVERYCETLKTLSVRTQLLFVTHNKISMELAEILIGVTMSEPGVSRLVAVDVEEALRMVAQ